MKSLIRAALLFLPLAASVSAQVRFGEGVPLTDARYESLAVQSKLIANGREVLLAWSYGSTLRMSPVAAGAPRIGRSVLSGGTDVVWTGRRFVAVSNDSVRVLDASGAPLGPATAHGIAGRNPLLATNGKTIAVLVNDPKVAAYLLTLDGVVTDDDGVILGDSRADTAIASNGNGYAALAASASGLQITLLDSAGAIVAQQAVDGAKPRRLPSIGSDGQRYLAAWNEEDGIRACFIREDGKIGAAFTLAAGTSLEAGTIVWTGTRYAIVYARRAPNSAGIVRVQVTYVDREGRIDAGTPLSTNLTKWSYLPSLATIGGRLFASWSAPEGTVVRDVAGDGDAPIRAAWAASLQTGAQVASSADATLVTWQELGRQAIRRVGLRGNDGSWHEQELSDHSLLLASDGIDFVVVRQGTVSRGSDALRIARDGSMHPLAAIPFAAFDVAWNGAEYVIAGGNDRGEIVAARLSRSGSLSGTVVVHSPDGTIDQLPAIASDGRGNVLFVWAEQAFPVQPIFPPPDIRASLRNAALQPSGPAPIMVEAWVDPDGGLSLDTAWDGSRYVVVYPQSAGLATGLYARGISPAGAVESQPVLVQSTAARTITSTAVRGGVAIVHASPSDDGRFTDRIHLLDGSGAVTALPAAPRIPAFGPESVAVASLPDGRLAFFHAQAAEDAPYYGSERIAIAIASPGLVPDAPVATVTRDAVGFRISWIAPPQPVTGYRVEHRLGLGGDWIELDRSFGAQEHEATFPLPHTTAGVHSFRVRAASDRGMSRYSSEVTVVVPRRRAAG